MVNQNRMIAGLGLKDSGNKNVLLEETIENNQGDIIKREISAIEVVNPGRYIDGTFFPKGSLNFVAPKVNFTQPENYNQSQSEAEANFEITNVDISQPNFVGGTLSAFADVKNTGGRAGTFRDSMILTGEIVDSTSVDLKAGESTTVTLSTTVDEFGFQVVSAFGKTESFNLPFNVDQEESDDWWNF